MNHEIESNESSSTSIIARQINDANDTAVEHDDKNDNSKNPIKTKEKVFDLYFEQNMIANDIERWLRNNLNPNNWTTDKDSHFHPFGLCLTKTETSDDYAILFQTIKDLSFSLHGHIFQIQILLAGAAQAITNGFVKVFGSIEKRIVCWVHVDRIIEENIKGLSQDLKQALINDFRQLQSTASKEIRNRFSIVKVKMDSQWMSEHTVGWYEGYAVGYPSTNSGIESMNRNIKDEATLRDCLPLRDFIRVMNTLIEKWSKDRNPSFETTQKFLTMPEISTHEWTLAFNWCKSKKRIVKMKQEGKKITCMFFPEKVISKLQKKAVDVEKALPALERNSIGPLNRELFQMPSSSIQVDTPISTVFN
ncbi:unnamed protein product [Brachionus calyciflorus]|uniref:MULE transposase domain-containing protein n=1 Tax=Brachionus calyciflorus TaxID=104777 RepID=A0A813MDC3_9BILA|nr:unnamed protein product [Brachionus calyciflorus]